MSVTDDPNSPIHDRSLRALKDFVNSKGIPSFKRVILELWGKRLFLLEFILISVWIILLTHKILDFNPRLIPAGREYLHILQYNYIWTLFSECGSCVFWNGFFNGGTPSFIDVHGPSLHPLSIIATLLFGVVNGGKVLVVGGIFIAAMAQWWVAKVVNLRRITRVWSACLVAAGGHLAGRMEIGNVGLLFSTASAGLVFAAFLDLSLNKEKRSPIALGITLALLILSGQGYLQLGIGVLLTFGFFFFYLDSKQPIQQYMKKYALAVALSLLLIGYFLVPFLRFTPDFAKETDPYLTQIQVMEYSPFNLVINDIDFYKAEILDKSGNAYLYISFIGWIPILFAGLALRLAPKKKKNLLIFLFLGLGLIFLISGRQIYQFLQKILPNVDAVRNASLISGLAVPILVALAAWGADLILKKDWGKLVYMRNGAQKGNISLSWVIILSLMAFSLYQVFNFSHSFLYLIELNVSQDELEALFTPSAQWVQPPYGEFFWMDDVFSREMKIANVFRPWRWEGRDIPPAYREISRSTEAEDAPGFVRQAGGMYLIENEENQYAFIETVDGDIFPCQATALGGKIDVICESEDGGVLTVMENNYSGWKVWINGKKSANLYGNWLSVDLSPGYNLISFRYRPLDVIFGLLLTISGIGMVIWFSIQKKIAESGKENSE